MAYMTYGTPHWRRMAEIHAKTARRQISATLLGESKTHKAYLIRTGYRKAWIPKSLVSHDPEKGTFDMPNWLAEVKLLS